MTPIPERSAGQDVPARACAASPRCRLNKEKAALDGGLSDHQQKVIKQMNFDATPEDSQARPLNPILDWRASA